MAEEKRKDAPAGSTGGGKSGAAGAATAKPKKKSKADPKHKPPQMLPPWKVLLHNDDKNDVRFVIDTIVELTPLNKQDAETRTKEADDTGVSLLLVTHKERAELYKDQFESKGLTVSIEPAEK
ncbi:MAG TPA: ATP-dependent Clp protease adaptor ClpS [Tepidisphaeraceae bacterium]|nr:ATP-dependent Clp protease adaptor ClpS [Tepidisphaeraceae bacterium]